ncbi:hypothetical protein LCI18_000181 [Fusarium solani-melongenae]|uniref:Uncharacterized protein n=1 Tax=Fusarium solani subsp. cucurbitae TaxID=2747967 RepID=A0ACD3YK19_FUSSC|nr:hypothetical protein LCI18_000181 [Fusarium solani-melongenae]
MDKRTTRNINNDEKKATSSTGPQGENDCTPLNPHEWKSKELKKWEGKVDIEPKSDIYIKNGGYDAFLVVTENPVEFEPSPPHEGLGFKNKYKASRIVEMQTERAPENYEDFLPYKMFLYRGWFSSNSEEDDGQQYVYISGEGFEGFFMHIKDVYDRMRAGNEALFQADYEAWKDRKGMFPYRTWDIHGKPDDGSRKSLYNSLTAYQPEVNSKIGSEGDDKKKMEDARLRKSQLSAFSDREFFGRYWGFSMAAAKEESRKAIEAGFFISFAKCVKEKAKEKLQGKPSDDDCIRTYLLDNMVKPVLDKPTLQFKPVLKERNIMFHDEEKRHFGEDSRSRTLQDHPTGLYRVLITEEAEEGLCNTNSPLRLPQYGLYESDSEAEKMNILMDKATKEKFTEAETHIEYRSIIRHRVQRNQNKCMSIAGTPAKTVAEKVLRPPLFIIGETEWLHRSAFSYGGLWRLGNTTNMGPNSSQNVHNLILGSKETNTVMMRYEAFVKRLATNSKEKVILKTNARYKGYMQNPSEEPSWPAERKYTWLVPVLIYDLTHSLLVGQKPREIYPFHRENCMIFQVHLDRKVEDFYYGWNFFSEPVSQVFPEVLPKEPDLGFMENLKLGDNGEWETAFPLLGHQSTGKN